MRILGAILAILIAFPAAADLKEVNGTATFGEREVLTPDAVMEVQMLELGTGAPEPIASIRIRLAGAKPWPFSLLYDTAMIRQGYSYAIAARISDEGEVKFDTERAIPFATGPGNPAPPQIILTRAEPEDGWDQPPLVRTAWKVISLGPDQPLATAANALLEFDETEARGTGGCNDFTTTFRVEPPKGLNFGELGRTLRGCTPATAQQERLVFRALGRTRSYHLLDDGNLILFNDKQEPLMILEPTK